MRGATKRALFCRTWRGEGVLLRLVYTSPTTREGMGACLCTSATASQRASHEHSDAAARARGHSTLAPIAVVVNPATGVDPSGALPDAAASLLDEAGWVLPASSRGRALEAHFSIGSEVLGRGHFGVVLRGRCLKTGIDVAIKRVSKASLAPLRSEVSVLLALRGLPHVIRLIDAFETAEHLFMVFELASGGELFAPLSGGYYRFSEREVSRIMRSLLCCVASMHAKGIVHRDLKPDNILMADESGVDVAEVKLIDFGLAAHVQPGTMLTEPVGSLYFAAPEILCHSPYSFPVDIWSLGAICYCLLSGRPPFGGLNERAIYECICKGRPSFDGPRWVGRTALAKRFVGELLARDALCRPTAEDMLMHPFVLWEGAAVDPVSFDLIGAWRGAKNDSVLYGQAHCDTAATTLHNAVCFLSFCSQAVSAATIRSTIGSVFSCTPSRQRYQQTAPSQALLAVSIFISRNYLLPALPPK